MLPLRTITTPTEQTLDGCSLAVSKSIAAKSFISMRRVLLLKFCFAANIGIETEKGQNMLHTNNSFVENVLFKRNTFEDNPRFL